MNNIIEGKHNGFCFGVEGAVAAVEEQLQKQDTVYTYGPIIHNEYVVKDLRSRGAIDTEEISKIPEGATVILRSHGIPKQKYADFQAANLNIVDATCPFVARIHQIVEAQHQQGKQIIIAGHKDHPEVIGINGFCDNSAQIVANEEDANAVLLERDAFLVAQTTFVPELFEKISDILKSKGQVALENTICKATQERQAEAAELAKQSDIMLVIGSKYSSNTNKLLHICKQFCPKCQIIENSDDVCVENIANNDIIGVVAGASTPQRLIREVIARMNQELNKPTGENETVEDVVTQQVDETADKTVTEAAPEETDAVEKEQTETEAVEEITETAEEETPAVEPEKAEDAAVEQPDLEEEKTEEVLEAESETESTEEQPAEEADDNELTFEEKFHKSIDETMVQIRRGQIKKGTVVQVVGDDVFVNIGYKADGIIPQNELSTNPDAVASELFSVGDEIDVEILRVNDGEGNVLLSTKSVERRQEDREAIAELEDGRHFDVKIRRAVKGGLLTYYKGARVFIPASQSSDQYVEDLNELVGKTMTVKALEVDKQRRRIVASRRQVIEEEKASKRQEKFEQFEVGQHIKGIVRRITDFGAFTEVGGIDGLIHVTDLSWGRVRHPSDVVSVDQEVEVEVLSVNPEAERISLGYKQLQPKPWDNATERYLVDDIIEVRVDRLVPFGAFVELEPGLHGLVHISEVAPRRIEKVEDELKENDVISVKVLDVDPERRRISLSRRAVIKPDEDREESAQHESAATESKPQPQRRERKPRARQERYDLPEYESASVSLADVFANIGLAGSDDSTEESVEEVVEETTPSTEEVVATESEDTVQEEIAEEE